MYQINYQIPDMILLEEIETLEQKLIEAMKKSNVDSLNELLHDDLVFHIPGGTVITKEMDIANYSSRNMQISDIQVLEKQIQLQEELAVVSVGIRMEGTYFDQPIDGNYRILRVWKKGNSGWQVIAGSSTISNV